MSATADSSVVVDQRRQLLNWIETEIPGYSDLVFHIVVIVWISFCAIAIHSFLRKIVFRMIARFKLADNDGGWLHTLTERKLFHNIVIMIQAAIVKIQAGLWLSEGDLLNRLISNLTDLWILFFGLMVMFSFIDTLQIILNTRLNKSHVPLKGVFQTVKLISCLLFGLVAVATLIGKSPLILLSGLGAISAVLMLVFKDPILGLVAGVQLSVNNMLSIGDWLEMPKHGADGDVIDICLTTVKVQNWDKTITTIPTYALISDSFKNWRGMSDSGGRRIKRSLLINTSSISFLNENDISRLMKNDLLATYLKEKLDIMERTNSGADMSVLLNGRRITNIGTFRKYLLSYLNNHPSIHTDRTLMVRQLAPSRDGLPIEIYGFAKTTEWREYENIQADIFDHIFAILPEFGLVVHESPTGNDILRLSTSNLNTREL